MGNQNFWLWWLRRHWEGKARLYRAFWFVGILPSVSFNFLYALAGDNLVLIGVISLFSVPWTFFALVSIWRCAWNVGWLGWGYVARILVVVNIISALLILVR